MVYMVRTVQDVSLRARDVAETTWCALGLVYETADSPFGEVVHITSRVSRDHVTFLYAALASKQSYCFQLAMGDDIREFEAKVEDIVRVNIEQSVGQSWVDLRLSLWVVGAVWAVSPASRAIQPEEPSKRTNFDPAWADILNDEELRKAFRKKET